MSHSYRRPYAAIVGLCYTAYDKRIARQGVRRIQNQALKMALKYGEAENFIVPHKYECPWNETYCWTSDGGKHYYGDYKNKPLTVWGYNPHEYYLKLCRK